METHDSDLHEWAQHNARLIREGRFEEVDAENVAEELEALSSSQRRELLSRLIVLIKHLLKWQYQPGRRSQNWINTINTQRREIKLILDESPSLRRLLPEYLVKAYSDSHQDAADETGIHIGIFPAQCPYSIERVLQRGFLPESIEE